MPLWGTDVGPGCPDCKETIWLYRPEDNCIVARCACCHHVESFAITLCRLKSGNITVKSARAAHHKFRGNQKQPSTKGE